MTEFNFKEETMEFPLVAACLARAMGPDADIGSKLLQRMIDNMNASEIVEYHKLYEDLKFSVRVQYRQVDVRKSLEGYSEGYMKEHMKKLREPNA